MAERGSTGRGARGGAALTTILGQLDPVLTAVTLPRQEDPHLVDVVIWDPLDRLSSAPDGVLLLVGVSPAHPLISDIIERAGDLEYAAVAIKCRDADLDAATTAADRSGVALLAVPDSVAWMHVEALLVAAISATGAHAPGLLSDPLTSDLFTLANAIADLTGAAITIEDVDRHVLAYSNIPGHAIDTSRRNSILGRYVPDLPEHVSEYREVSRSTTAVRFAAYAGTLARVVMPVRVGGRLLGSIWAIDDDGQRSAHIATHLAESSSQVALHLLRIASQQDLERHHRSEILAAALGNRLSEGGRTLLPPQDLPAALIGFRALADPHETVDLHRLVRLVGLTAEASSPQSWCAEDDGVIFVLLPRSDRLGASGVAHLAESTMSSVGRSFGVDVECAYAAEVQSRDQLPRMRLDIGRALRCGTQRPVDVMRERYLVCFQELVESGVAGPDQLIPQVAALLEHDGRHRTEYARTLLTHLECAGDVRRAAAALGVHENSHRYRMRKILGDFDIDLDVPELRFVAWLQLRTAVAAD